MCGMHLCRIKQLAIQAGKKTYLVVIGKPAPEKLANFPEVSDHQVPNIER